MGQKQTNFAEPEPFIALAVISTLLLFGVLIADGAFLAVVKNVVYGTFSDVTPRYTTYIGNVVIDTLLAQCVSFWTPVLTKMPAALLLSTSLCASLQTLAVWAIIEGLRASIFVPIYAIVELRHYFGIRRNSLRSDVSIPYAAAQALIPGAVLTLVRREEIGMADSMV